MSFYELEEFAESVIPAVSVTVTMTWPFPSSSSSSNLLIPKPSSKETDRTVNDGGPAAAVFTVVDFLMNNKVKKTWLLLFVQIAAFTPQDNYLINCGSSKSSVVVDNRRFVGDSSKNSSAYLKQGKSIALENPNPSPTSSVLHASARVFTSASSYAFDIKSMGTHFVRLHFSPFSCGNYDLGNGNFSVLANGVSLLSNFGADFSVSKEFLFMVDRLELEILFFPTSDSTFAFVNAIEVFSAPKDFFVDDGGIALISPDGIQEFKQKISSQILETVHRVNVGGPRLTPFNDTLWRSWVPDEEFLVLKSAAKIAVTTNHQITTRWGY
ncbi:putative receptor-like protein kinase [Sesamum alatum]|uniref:Receptor-like protein kinase n=1 Tax=Sesamum alatum TaxID=300844 RepID=A0AAE1YUL6_9LAMI|nr:putative receptor-like protein kinase [Sesamum alatum]